MRVKVGNNWFDSHNQPICVELSDEDKAHIAGMPGKKYASFPDNSAMSFGAKMEWMADAPLESFEPKLAVRESSICRYMQKLRSKKEG